MTKEERRIYDKIRNKKYYKENREREILRSIEYQKLHKEEVKLYKKKNKEKIKIHNKRSKEKNKEKIKLYKKTDKVKISNKLYREKNKEKIRKAAKLYREKNKDIIRKNLNTKLKNDKLFRLKYNIRRGIHHSFKKSNIKKNTKTFIILGCSFDDLKKHIELQWESWMNWDNYGKYNGELNFGWDIDHIIPISTAKTEEKIIKLNHYTNLQPLCSYTNRYIKKAQINYSTAL